MSAQTFFSKHSFYLGECDISSRNKPKNREISGILFPELLKMMNMEEIYKIETIEQYNNMYGFKTMHPLVAYVEFNESNSKFIPGRHTMGFYSLFLKETKGCVINYGKTKYDFDGQTIVSIAPDQVVGYESVAGVPKKAKGILFHPDFLHGTSLERKMKDYTFFSYASNEALHLSEDERKIIADCMAIVSKELQNPIDRHTKSLITTNIELILDYCLLSASVRI